jgi:hypothetical protein
MLTLTAVMASLPFTGAAVDISIVEHPARMSLSTEIAAAQWAPSYKRATVMQVSLAVIAAVAGLVQWWKGGGAAWLSGALLILSVIPFTAIVVMPTTNELPAPGRDLASPETRLLLEKWRRLHAVRSGLSLVAPTVFLWSTLRTTS